MCVGLMRKDISTVILDRIESCRRRPSTPEQLFIILFYFFQIFLTNSFFTISPERLKNNKRKVPKVKIRMSKVFCRAERVSHGIAVRLN